MALILNIDTSTYNSSIALSDEDKVIAYSITDSCNHTQVLLFEIKKLLTSAGASIKNLSAVAVNIGPGSYTGLRVGLSAAKGICYSSELPLIPVFGLTALVCEAIKQNKDSMGAYVVVSNNYRNGWYYAVYDEALNNLLPLDSIAEIENIFPKIHKSPIFVCQSLNRRNNLLNENNIIYLPPVSLNACNLAPIAFSHLHRGNKYDISSVQPLYISSIFSP